VNSVTQLCISLQVERTISVQHPGPSPTYASIAITHTQTAALVYTFGGDVEFKNDYLVPRAGDNEVLAQLLDTGGCQSDENGLELNTTV
jgi:hypothetical protein